MKVRARKRYNKLYEDGMKDEADRMDRLVNNFSKHFNVKRSKMHDIVYSFEGTILELYRFYAKRFGLPKIFFVYLPCK